jgi:arsenate reductase-like glutaredoxin family protein
MEQPPELEQFLQRIINISVLRMGGAVAGILGSAGTDNEVLNSLKNATIAFAVEFKKSAPNKDELRQLANDIQGYLRTLQLTNTLSEEETNKLLNTLQDILAKA